MKTLRRFSSFEELKSTESAKAPEAIVLKRHRAFARLLALIRANRGRKRAVSKR
jgi:hypothetical protein